MFAFLLIVQTLIAIALISVILMQRSEGGGLGVGGSSSGFMTARGAADFLTRSTAVLGALFIILSIVMAAIAGANRTPSKIDTSLAGKTSTPIQQTQPAPVQPTPVQPTPVQPTPVTNSPAPAKAPDQNQQAPAVPLAQ